MAKVKSTVAPSTCLRVGLVAFCLLSSVLSVQADPAGPGFCDPLPRNPSDNVITVDPSQTDQLPFIVAAAGSDTTILLKDGTYSSLGLNFVIPRVSLRSESGNRDAVILDANYFGSETMRIYASNVTIADITIMRAATHPVQVAGGGHNAMLYNLHIIDGGQQFVKVNPDGDYYNDFGTLACSSLEMTPAGRTYVETHPDSGACYTGGLDAHQAWGWTIRDNTIRNIYCSSSLTDVAEHAIHIWNSSRDPVIERNVLINNARGIGLGLGNVGGQRIYEDDPLRDSGLSPADVQVIGGIIRNNMVFGSIPAFDTGIGLEQVWNVKVFHNTVYSSQRGLGLDIRFPSSKPVVENNLLSPDIDFRDGGTTEVSAGNVVASPAMFVDSVTGNLHLVSDATQAIHQGVSLASAVPTDIDGDVRDPSTPDVGADEFTSARSLRIPPPPYTPPRRRD